MNPIGCDAIIFDLDGVLVDSTPCLERQMRSWAARHGLDAAAVLSLAHGRKTIETIRLAAPHLDAEVEATAIEAAEAADTEGVVEMPGARALLVALPPKAWAIATSNSRRTASMRLRHTAMPIPRVLISAEADLQAHKAWSQGFARNPALQAHVQYVALIDDDTPPFRAERELMETEWLRFFVDLRVPSSG